MKSDFRKSKLQWPKYPYPNPREWKAWHKFAIPQVKNTKVGRWLQHPKHQVWTYHLVNPTTIRQRGSPDKFFTRDTTFSAPFFRETDQTPIVLFKKRVSVIARGNYRVMTRSDLINSSFHRPSPQNPPVLRATNTYDILTGASDGSVQKNTGFCGWAIYNGEVLLESCKGRLPQQENTIESQRTELVGIYLLVLRLCELRPSSAKILCDNQSAVERVFYPSGWGTSTAIQPNMDVIFSTQLLMEQSNTRFTGRWVRSHAERRNVEPTPDQEKNMVADKLASEASADPSTPLTPETFERFTLSHHGKLLTSQHAFTVKRIVERREFNEYWKRKNDIPDPETVEINSFYDS